MPRYFLKDVYDKFSKEVDWLLLDFEKAIHNLKANSTDKSARLAAEMAVIRLHDSWARYSREIIVLSAGGKPFTVNGSRVPLAPGVRHIPDVIPKLISSYRRRDYEPQWARSQEAVDAAQRLKIQNFTTVSAALGATNSPAEEIRPLRNFLAHRGRDSAMKVRVQTIFLPSYRVRVEDIAGAFVPPGITRYEQWVANLKHVALAAIQ